MVNGNLDHSLITYSETIAPQENVSRAIGKSVAITAPGILALTHIYKLGTTG